MRQKYGQNFLADKNIALKIVNAANLAGDDFVVEIGPGKGALTKFIVGLTNNFLALEIDRTLSADLKNAFPNANFINVDALKFDFPTHPYKVVSNLPYNAATAIIGKILPSPQWTEAVFMVQKEVAQRILAHSGCKEFGYFTLFCSYFAQITHLFDVRPTCFNPQPKVMSAVISCKNKTPNPPPPALFKLIKHCFGLRRKTILNSISSFINLDKKQTTEICLQCNLDPMLRPDRLSLADWLLLTDCIKM
jgi:16S rRNA (adenine1518-N6/adenine1519-N6)-dimethyltransferase